MEQIILEVLAGKTWIWMQELESQFMICDLLTRRITLNPEFIGAIRNLVDQGLIEIVNRLEIKGYYKKCGEIVYKTGYSLENI